MTDKHLPFDGNYRRPRGVYGTNPGDTWFAADWLNERIKAEKGRDWAALIWVDDDGEERVFTTQNQEMIQEAREGTVRYAQEHAQLN